MALVDSNFDTKDLLSRLERRASFHSAVHGIHTAVASCSPNNESKAAALWPLVQRCHTLLRTRYSSFEAWRAGKKLFTCCLDMPFHPREMASIRQFVKDAEAELAHLDGGAGGMPAGHVSSSGTDAAAAVGAGGGEDMLRLSDILLESSRHPDAHYDDAGPIVDDPERLRRAQVGLDVGPSTTTAGATAAQGGDATMAAAEGTAAAPGEAGAARAVARQQRLGMQQAILEGIQAVYSGMDAVTRGTAAIEGELDSIIEMIHATGAAGGGRRPPPPASRLVLAALPRVTLAAEDLERLGPGCVCAVCTDELKVGDEVQLLPCKHSYHVPCLKPWLDKHNSCPTCRHELPTDDARYEAQKEKDKEEAEERRGSANALSHNERMYT